MAVAAWAVAMAVAMVGMDTAVATHLAVEDSGPMDSSEELLLLLGLLDFSCDSLTMFPGIFTWNSSLSSDNGQPILALVMVWGREGPKFKFVMFHLG